MLHGLTSYTGCLINTGTNFEVLYGISKVFRIINSLTGIIIGMR